MKFKSFNVAELAAKRALLRTLKEEISFLQATVKAEREFERSAREQEKAEKLALRERKALQREYRRNARIAKAEELLEKLKNPKRASKVKVYTGEDAIRLVA